MKIDIYHYHHHSPDIREILTRLETLETFIMALDPAVQKIVDDVAANTSLAQSALAALSAESDQIKALQQQVTDLQTQLANGTPISAENLAALGAAATALEATNTALQPAVPANTPAA